MKKKKRSYTVYFGGELFTLKHLIGNAYLAEAIYDKSHGKYLCQLPQDFEPRGKTTHAVRDQDIAAEIIGINIYRYKLTAFAISSFYAGVCGVLYPMPLYR